MRHFTKNCKEIVYKESKLNDKENRLFCDPMELITLTEGWKWLQTKKKQSDILLIKQKYYTLASSVPKSTVLNDVAKQYIRGQRSGNYEEGFDEWSELRATVYELVKHEKFFTCNCPLGMKKHWCKHRIGMMIKFNMISIQDK